MYGFIMACIELYATDKNLATCGFQKYARHTHQKPAEAEPNFSLPLQSKTTYAFLRSLGSGLESFGHKSTPSDRPRIEAYCPKF